MAVLLLGLAALLCGIQAIRTPRLLIASLWLAVTSALVAVLLFTLGAASVAVIELSVGAGLVTVLLVFAIAVAGEEPLPRRGLVPAPLAWGLSVLAVALLAWLLFPLAVARPALSELPVAVVLWQQRGLDVLLQIALIFSGTLGVLGLLAEGIATLPGTARIVSPVSRQPRDGSTRLNGSPLGANGHDSGPEQLEKQPQIAHMGTKEGVNS